jgi:hypothetical protein
MFRRVDRDLSAVERMYDSMESILAGPGDVLRRRTPVSGWSASEQIQHILLVNKWALLTITAMLLGRGDFPESGRMNWLGTTLLLLGRIPRGKSKAPAAAEPVPDVSNEELLARLRKQKGYLERIRSRLDEVVALRLRFPHPYLGHFSATDGIRFVRVHTDHHLKIVDDILQARHQK